MVWRAHGTRQMQLQLLLGREHQPPSLGHMKDWFSLWQDGVKLPFFSWSLPHLQSSKEPQPPVHRPGDKKITYIKDYAFAVTGEFCFWSLKLHSGKKKEHNSTTELVHIKCGLLLLRWALWYSRKEITVNQCSLQLWLTTLLISLKNYIL